MGASEPAVSGRPETLGATDQRPYGRAGPSDEAGAMTAATGSRLQDLSRPECVALLAGSAVGRIAVTLAERTVILPINFAIVDGRILFRTGRGTKLAAATAGVEVAFEADGYAPDGSAGWSVLVRGHCTEVTDADELSRARAVPLDRWVTDGTGDDRFVVVTLTEISGRRFDTDDRTSASLSRARPWPT